MKKTGFALRYKFPRNKERIFVPLQGYPADVTFTEAWIGTREVMEYYCKQYSLEDKLEIVEMEVTCVILSDKKPSSEVEERCEVYAQRWEYSDEWSGPESAGTTLHLTYDAAIKHVKSQIESLPGKIPAHGYMRVNGQPRKIIVKREIRNKIVVSGFVTIIGSIPIY